MKLFQLWRQAGGGVKTCEDLAAITGVDQELLCTCPVGDIVAIRLKSNACN